MSDSYQAIYDAVRSKISNGDVGSAIENAIRDASISFYFDQASNRAMEAASQWDRPSVLHKPALSRDGNMWCALLGEDLMQGVAGFGESPYLAMLEFDKAFYAKIEEPTHG